MESLLGFNNGYKTEILSTPSLCRNGGAKLRLKEVVFLDQECINQISEPILKKYQRISKKVN